MPRFFFHIREGDKLDVDPEGTEFPSPEDAVADARKAAREMLAELLLAGERLDGQHFEITSEDGNVVDVVSFRSVLNIH